MEKLTYEEIAVISDCILLRINEMYRERDVFSCYPETLGNIDDAIIKLKKLNDKVCSIMKDH